MLKFSNKEQIERIRFSHRRPIGMRHLLCACVFAVAILHYFASESWSQDDWLFWIIAGPI